MLYLAVPILNLAGQSIYLAGLPPLTQHIIYLAGPMLHTSCWANATSDWAYATSVWANATSGWAYATSGWAHASSSWANATSMKECLSNKVLKVKKY